MGGCRYKRYFIPLINTLHGKGGLGCVTSRKWPHSQARRPASHHLYVQVTKIACGTMASQQDVQGLLRLLTTGRNKVPMLQAMGRVKGLQKAGLNRYASTTFIMPPMWLAKFLRIQYCRHSLYNYSYPSNSDPWCQSCKGTTHSM